MGGININHYNRYYINHYNHYYSSVHVDIQCMEERLDVVYRLLTLTYNYVFFVFVFQLYYLKICWWFLRVSPKWELLLTQHSYIESGLEPKRPLKVEIHEGKKMINTKILLLVFKHEIRFAHVDRRFHPTPCAANSFVFIVSKLVKNHTWLPKTTYIFRPIFHSERPTFNLPKN